MDPFPGPAIEVYSYHTHSGYFGPLSNNPFIINTGSELDIGGVGGVQCVLLLASIFLLPLAYRTAEKSLVEDVAATLRRHKSLPSNMRRGGLKPPLHVFRSLLV